MDVMGNGIFSLIQEWHYTGVSSGVEKCIKHSTMQNTGNVHGTLSRLEPNFAGAGL